VEIYYLLRTVQREAAIPHAALVIPQGRNMAAKTSRADFEAVFPQLVEEVSQAALKYNIPANALKWFQTVCPRFLEL
jgi:hypothetical protein